MPRLPYREDLARLHDAHFGMLARGAASVLLEALRRRKLRSGLVVDLGCGSGILSEIAADRGYGVLGIDLSPDMLKLARRRVPGGTFRRGSAFEAEIPPCVAVAAVGECFNYRFDPRASEAALSNVLKRIHRALVPGGVLLFDMSAPGRGSIRSHFTGKDWAILVETKEDVKRRVLTRRITTFLERGSGSYRRTEEAHRLTLVPRANVLARLRAAGFRARALPGYGGFRFPKGLVGYLALKSGS